MKSSRLRNVAVVDFMDFEGRIIQKAAEICKSIDKPAKGGGCRRQMKKLIFQNRVAWISGLMRLYHACGTLRLMN